MSIQPPLSPSKPSTNTFPPHSGYAPNSSENPVLNETTEKVTEITQQARKRALFNQLNESNLPNPSKKIKLPGSDNLLFLPLPFLPTSQDTTASTGSYAPSIPNKFLPDFRKRWGTPTEPTSAQKAPPPAPKKKARSLNEIPSPYKTQYEQLQSGVFMHGGNTFKASHFADGSYSSVYLVTNSNSCIIPNIDNSALVLKSYHGKGTGFPERILNTYLAHSVENYRQILPLGLNVAPIYNIDSAETDRAIIQKKIANPIDFLDDKQMDQIKLFFNKLSENQVMMDLQPQNFREENGIVYLIDFVEKCEEPLIFWLNLALKAWTELFYKSQISKDDAEKKLKHLSTIFLKSGQHLNDASIQEFLD